MQEQEEAYTGQVGMMPRVCTDYMGAAMNHRHCVHGAGAGRGSSGLQLFAAAVGSTVSAGVKRLITPVISAELHAPREIAEARTALAIFRIGVRCSWRRLPPSWQTQPARR